MSELKELIERLEKAVEKFEDAMDRALFAAKASAEVFSAVINDTEKWLKDDHWPIIAQTGERILSREENNEYSKK